MQTKQLNYIVEIARQQSLSGGSQGSRHFSGRP